MFNAHRKRRNTENREEEPENILESYDECAASVGGISVVRASTIACFVFVEASCAGLSGDKKKSRPVKTNHQPKR